jgi:hypothetical protein
MITNYAKNMYKMIEQVKIKPVENKPRGSGLLTPAKSFMRNNTSNNISNEPAYRIAKYTNTIRNKRMELKNNGSETA